MISYRTKRAQRYNSATQHPAVVQPPGNSSLKLYTRVAAVVVGDYFDRSLRCSTRLYVTTLAAAVSAASVKGHAGVKCKDRLDITLVLTRSLYLCSCWRAPNMISYHTKRAQRYNPTAQQQR